MNQTNMKTSSSNKLFLCAAALAIRILGDTLAQAQPAVEAWLRSYNWSNVVTTPADNGTTKTVILNSPAGSAFFRLIHP